MSLDSITNSSSELLQNKTFGGVSRESALKAIKDAAEKVDKASKEIIGKIQEELESYKGKTVQEMAELTSQKDFVTLQLKNAKESLEQAEASLDNAKKVKVHEKTLPNGNKEIRKVNKNGAVMVKELTPDGAIVKSCVTQLDGSIRRTIYDPVTGKPIKTFTNIGEDRLMEYDSNGEVKSSKAVNKKKVKPEKPTLVSQTPPQYYELKYKRDSGDSAQSFEKHYSDGSKETVIYCYKNDNSLRYIKTEKQHKDYFEEKITVPDSHEKITRYYKDEKQIFIEKLNDGSYEYYCEAKVDTLNKRYFPISITKKGGRTYKEKAILDENGAYTGKGEYTEKDNATGKIIEKRIKDWKF